MKVNGFKQMITSSTRITEDTSTLIDLLFVNKPSNFLTAKVIATSLSDHEMIFCSRKINTHKHPNRTKKCRNYRAYDQQQMMQTILTGHQSTEYTTSIVLLNFFKSISKLCLTSTLL